MGSFRLPIGRAPRIGALAACVMADGAPPAAAAAPARTPGAQACPVVLRMAPGATSIHASGSVSGERPDYYFKFAAKPGRKLTIHIVGGGVKTGPGVRVALPNGAGDAVDVDTPFALPATGAYAILLHANTMSEGPFGRFEMTLRIKRARRASEGAAAFCVRNARRRDRSPKRARPSPPGTNRRRGARSRPCANPSMDRGRRSAAPPDVCGVVRSCGEESRRPARRRRAR